jgi:hypothetical protein
LAQKRQAVVLGQRTRAVGEFQGIGVEAEFEVADQRPAPADRLAHLEADDRRTQRVRGQEPARAAGGLRDQISVARAERPVERRAVGLEAIPCVDRAVEGQAGIGQRALGGRRVEVVIEAPEAVGRRRW